MTRELQQGLWERERTEAKLREVTEFQQTILDQANYSIVSITPAGMITTVNSAAERLFDYQAADLVGQPIYLLFGGEIQVGQPLAQTINEITTRNSDDQTLGQRADGIDFSNGSDFYRGNRWSGIFLYRYL